MLSIRGLYEIAIPVKQLSRAEPFYREVLGLEVGLRDEISTQGPIFHDWIPGKSLYFRDPDGHDLELFARRR